MNTNQNDNSQAQNNAQTTDPQQLTSTVDSNTVQALNQLLNEVQSLDTTSPQAEQNATSISDGNGGRIELNEDLNKDKKPNQSNNHIKK